MKRRLVAAAAMGFLVSSLGSGVGHAAPAANTCIVPYVWRNARPGDDVCVLAATRQTVAAENANPGANKVPGSDTCLPTFVWREAFPGDTICVPVGERQNTLADNAAAASRVVGNPSACVWQINGPVTISHSDGVTVKVFKWDGTYADTGAKAQLFLQDGTPAWLNSDGYPIGHYSYTAGNNAPLDAPSVETGRPFGGIKGNDFDMTIVWDGKDNRAGSNRYLGTVDSNGIASGTDVNSQNQQTTNWHIDEKFACGS
jgi:hypothetical protein